MIITVKKSASCLLAFLCISTAFAQDTLFKKKSIVKTMEHVADWQLNTWKEKGFTRAKYDWTNGACYAGLFELGKMSKKDVYLPFLVGIGNELDWNTGPRHGMADDYCIGQLYSNLYVLYKDPKMIVKWRLQADSIIAAPHTESLEWKNKISLRRN